MVMLDGAEKGRRYSQIFRKAGALLGKGNIARAVATLKVGQALAEQLGDREMARRFMAEIEAAQQSGNSR
jgi:hypothetical protein